ncbi:MAG: hypothetical protein UCJ13_05680, partial [Bacteroidaceae bacterium]|nr:hypothetical protein [Bacteroidaceae bacterium]
MDNSQMSAYRKRRKNRAWKQFVHFVACLVIFCTVYVLVLPAFTLEEQHGCGLQAHTHGEMCYETATQSRLVCGLEESEEHTHSGACFVSETVEPMLVCELVEHTHTTDCDPDLTADVETEADWTSTFSHITRTGNWGEDLAAIAGTQLGYRESQRNYQLKEDGTKPGYTRYGAWYGSTYGDWDAMFVAFCLHYADIPETAVPR